MRRLSLLLLLATSPAVHAQTVGGEEHSAWKTLSACAQLEESDHTSLSALEADCPGLRHALYELGYLDMLPQASLDELNLWRVKELEQIAERYREPLSASSIDPAALDSVLDSLQRQNAQQPPSLWERFRAWLREIFGRQGQQEQSPSWFTQWLENVELSEKVKDIIFWSVVALVIGLALGVVINELRAAGVVRRRSLKAGVAESIPAPLAAATVVRLEDLDRAPRSDRPSILLRILISTLQQTGRLTSAKSLTHREVTSRATFDGADQHEAFQRIARLAEGTLYGGVVPADEEVDAVVKEGRRLDARLRGAFT